MDFMTYKIWPNDVLARSYQIPTDGQCSCWWQGPCVVLWHPDSLQTFGLSAFLNHLSQVSASTQKNKLQGKN